ncbi:MAG: hypothetical protein ACE5EY_08300 [Anaerolineae bacterium]
MNKETQKRIALARQIAPGYIENPKVAAVVIAGSVSRGWADSYSDIELDVYWQQQPIDTDRLQPIERNNGQLILNIVGSGEFAILLYDHGYITYETAVSALQQTHASKKQKRLALVTLETLKRHKES